MSNNHSILDYEAHIAPRLGDSTTSTGESSNSLISSNSSGPTTITNQECDGHDKCHNTHHSEQQTEQSELRKQIQKIQNEAKLSSTQKAQMIQNLMSKPFLTKQRQEQEKNGKVNNFLTTGTVDYSLVLKSDKVQTYHGSGSLGCKHYQRASKLQAHCCGKWYPCRFCHDEVSDHEITRNLINTMMCMYCWQTQPAARQCINTKCGKILGSYFCNVCKLWDSDERKNIYHCEECGICRIGIGLGKDYFHCKTCNVCMAMSLYGRHKCIERNLECDCPICGEYMFTSTSTVIFMVFILIAVWPLYASQMSSTACSNIIPVSNVLQITW